MHRLWRWISIVLLLLTVPAFGKDESGSATCAYATKDGEFGQTSDCLGLDKKGNPVVASKHVRKLRFAANGLADVYSSRLGWMYVNRSGKIVIRGVAVMDNGADYFCDGLVRFSRAGKWGFANARGREVVAPQYDGALPFEKGVAKVCRGCESKCAEAACEHHVLTGGEWLCINTRGETVTCPK